MAVLRMMRVPWRGDFEPIKHRRLIRPTSDQAGARSPCISAAISRSDTRR